MCEKGQRLRVLVNERLTAAAQEIFALFERTIAEYEEELCRSKEENKRKQQLLDSVLSPQVLLHRTVFPKRQGESGPSLDQENSLCIQEKQEELCIKHEFTSFSDIAVAAKDFPKSEGESEENSLCIQEKQEQSIKHEQTEFSVIPDVAKVEDDQFQSLQQKQTENGEDCGRVGPVFDPHGYLHSQTQDQADTDNDDDWGPPCRSSAQQKETKAVKDGHNQVHCKNLERSSQETKRELSMFGVRRKIMKTHACPTCGKTFSRKADLQRHIRSHTGEKPFSCSVCNRCFTQRSILKLHMSVHTRDTTVSCSECGSSFTQKRSLASHMRTIHRKEKPFSCSMDITIQRGDSLPEIKRCSECCTDFHCPFCAPQWFHSTKLCLTQKHLKGHFNRSVKHEGFTFHRCRRLCRTDGHYHCLYCSSTVLRKAAFMRHLQLCHLKSQTHPSTTTTPAAAPATTQDEQVMEFVRKVFSPIRNRLAGFQVNKIYLQQGVNTITNGSIALTTQSVL